MLGQVDEVADLVVLLLSDRSGVLTGSSSTGIKMLSALTANLTEQRHHLDRHDTSRHDTSRHDTSRHDQGEL